MDLKLGNNIRYPNVVIDPSVQLGHFNVIGEGAVLEEGVILGSYNIIDAGVRVGVKTRIRSHVELRRGTVVGARCYIDSGVKSSGECVIEDDVVLRYDAIIARGCRICRGAYICPQVMTNNLNHEREAIGGAHVGEDCFIGTNATLAAGIEIADNVIIGAKALVTKDITEAGIYIGIPAKRR